MEEVIEGFRDGFTPHQFKYSQDQSHSSTNNVLILLTALTLIVAGYSYYRCLEKKDEAITLRKA